MSSGNLSPLLLYDVKMITCKREIYLPLDTPYLTMEDLDMPPLS